MADVIYLTYVIKRIRQLVLEEISRNLYQLHFRTTLNIESQFNDEICIMKTNLTAILW